MKFSWMRALSAALLVISSGCMDRTEIEALKQGQTEILAKLEKLEKQGGRPQAPPQAPPGPDAGKVYSFPVGDSPIKGATDAWVTVIEVSDFQCPFCGRAASTLKELEQKYGADLRLVFKHNPLPFHNRALPAAMATECGREQNKFWPLHDKLFENQRELEDPALEKYAKEAGLDLARFKKCMTDGKHKARIEADQTVAARLGARGTPAFFINGRFLSGAQPLPAFQAIVDEELKKAKESSVAKKDYYAKMVEEKGEKAL